jgi:hypothetical protein
MGDFIPSCLTPLSKTYSLKNIAVIDIETDRWLDYGELKDIPIDTLKKDWHNKAIPTFLLAYYDAVTQEEKIFDGKDCMEKFLTFYLTKSHRDKITYAYNGGGFDFTKLHETLVTSPAFSKFIPQIIYVNGGIMILRIRDNNNHKWQFRDAMYLLKGGLNALCKSFNPHTKKLKMPIPPEGMTATEHYRNNKQIWQEYCMNDCKSLAEILSTFNDLIINRIGGCIGATASSTAMRTFRRRFLKINLPTYFTWNSFIRLGYYGGRTEVFNMYAKLRGEPYYYYDVNSMYPSVMYDNIFPISTPKRVNYKDPWDCAGKCGFMECEVESPEGLAIPVLPYRDTENHGKLLFPLGSWKAVYEFSLIEKALALGYTIKPLRTIEFEGDYLFKEYIDTIYPIKQNSTGALREIAKLLQNGLYGKFGEHSERELIITEPEADILGTYPIPNDPMGYTTKKIVKYCAHHLPAIAARVTALAELRLYSGIEHIQNRKGVVYYCDTDSMITDTKMPTSNRLGDWDLEEEITQAVFFAPKAYCYEYLEEDKLKIVQKLKGFSHDFTKTLVFDDFKRALPPWNDFSAFNEPSIHPASFKEISTRSLCGFSTVVKTRNIKKEYDKRKVLEDYETEPLLILHPSL